MNAIVTIDQLRADCPAIFATSKAPSRSEKYTFLPTYDAVLALQNEGFSVAAAKQSRCRDAENAPFTKHMVRLRAPGLGNDEVTPEVILTNSHNGNGAYRCMGGAFRSFCFNGLVTSEGRIMSVHVPHRGDVVAQVIEGVMQVMSNARNLTRVMNDWRQVTMSEIAQLDFAEQAYRMRWPLEEGKQVNAIQSKSFLDVRRDADKGDDLWHVFNRVQEAVMQGGSEYQSIRHDEQSGRTRIRNIKSRPVRGIDNDVKLNQKLWALAEEVAA